MKRPLLISLSLSILVIASGCKMEDPSASEGSIGSRTLPGGASAVLIQDLSTAFQGSSYDQATIDNLVNGASDEVFAQGQEESTSQSVVAPSVEKGAQLALNQSPSITDNTQKIAAIELIASSITLSAARSAGAGASTRGPLWAISGANLGKVVQAVTSSAVGNLDESGFSGSEATASVKSLVKKVSSTLRETGIQESDYASVSQSIARGAVSSFDEAGISTSSYSDLVSNVTNSVMSGLVASGVSLAVVVSASGQIAQGSIAGLGSTGADKASIKSYSKNAVNQTLSGLKNLGATNDQMATAASTVASKMVLGLADAGFSQTEQNDATADIKTSIESALQGAGLSATQISTVSTSLATALRPTSSTTAASTSGTGTGITSATTATTTTASTTTSTSTTPTSSTPASYVFSKSSILLTEGGSAAVLTVKLAKAPDASVIIKGTVSVPTEAQVGGGNSTNLTFTPTNWSTPQTVSVTPVNDGVKDPNIKSKITWSLVSTSDQQGYKTASFTDTSLQTLNIQGYYPDTGQSSCFNGLGASITCPAPGDALAQDGSYNAASQQSFTASGTTSPVVKDNVTNLTWQKAKNTSGWLSTTQATAICTTTIGSYNGLTGWRLPTMLELMFLEDHQEATFHMDPTFTQTTTWLWSSTLNPNNNAETYDIHFDTGVGRAVPNGDGDKVLCVTGTGLTLASFTANKGGAAADTVTDNTSNLMWDQRETTTKTWEQALSYCEALSHAGFSDWRLPNVNELATLIDFTSTALVNKSTGAGFPNTLAAPYWSSTSRIFSPTNSWTINFNPATQSKPSGNLIGFQLKTSTQSVRCVR